MKNQSKIMYIENKNTLSGGYARIGKVKFSKTGATIYYNGKSLRSLKGMYYFDVETGEVFWISGCHKDGQDRLHHEHVPVFIDDDIREEYWLQIRNLPQQVHHTVSNL